MKKSPMYKIIMQVTKRKVYERLLGIGVGVVACFFILNDSSVWADTASYYTYESCRREGTSGVYTASGERFNENDLTCAMRSREWGAKYKVTNLANGKSVIVRLNDFGPNKKLWNKGRKIDLSKGAFQKIASLRQGVIKVKIERIGGD